MKKNFIYDKARHRVTWLQSLVVAALCAAFWGLAGCSRGQEHQHETTTEIKKQQYHCPMHPTYVSDKVGKCPICGMDLVPIENNNVTATNATSKTPGRDMIFIAPERQQQIGLTTATVEKKKLTRTIRATASFEPDETRRHKISPRVGGWVQELYANYTSQWIKQGDPLFKLYSPELLVTEREYLNALRSKDKTLIAAARKRLALWDIADEQINELEKNGEASDSMILVSPVTGHILMKDITQGQSFMAGETLYEIADLTRLWLHAYIYELEAPFIKVGQQATVYLSHQPNRLYDAKVTFIYPNIDQTSRTIQVRLEIDNSDLAFKPDMWANVELNIELGEGITVPADSVIDTGKRLITFISHDDNHLEPREIKIRAKGDNEYLVKEGLAEGERVVARSLFLVDSESQLQAAIAGMGGHSH